MPTPPPSTSPYRPHNPGHDYYDRGIYLITLVVTGRQSILAQHNNDARHPQAVPTPLGTIVYEEWQKTAEIQLCKGRHIRLYNQVCMPDHWHGIIEVQQRMDKPLGYIIQCFKSACTARWRREITGYVEPASSSAMIRSSSTNNRRRFYATQPLVARPLFDDDYDDTICLSERHLQAMIHYVDDNPRRAILRHLLPQFMERRMHVVIDGVDYAAFGNLFLLRWPRKLQVFCHRMARLATLTPAERQQHGYAALRMLPEAEATHATRIPYETTAHYAQQVEQWTAAIMVGGTVIVTPGISRGELQVKNLCLERGFPLIHLQKEPIGPYWKPEQQRFAACVAGSLLILAPWHVDDMGAVQGVPSATDYSRFHNLNKLAEKICDFDGEARIVNG